MTLALWIDPNDNSVVSKNGSPETERINAITDKSEAGNDVVGSANIALLCEFEGTNGDTTYTSDDVNARSFTFVNGAQISSADFKFGSTCLDVNSASDSIIVTPSPNDLTIGSNDFTVECFFKATSLPASYMCILDTRTTGTQVAVYLGIKSPGNNLVFYMNGADTILGPVISTGTWYHVVLEKTGGTTRMWLDGVQAGSDYSDSNTYITGTTSLGARNSFAPGGGLVGYIDSFRMSIGKAIFKGLAPTVPTGPLNGPRYEYVIPSSPENGQALRFETGWRLVKPNASPALINMDGPDITAIVAYGKRSVSPEDSPVAATLFGVDGVASPLDDTGWRIKDASGTGNLRGSIGDEATNFIELSGFGSPEKNNVVLTMVYDSSKSSLYGFNTGVAVDGIEYTGTPGFAQDLIIGDGHYGLVYDVLYFDGVLSSDDIQRAEGYLAHKWNFPADLPADHPFRYVGPDIESNSEFIANFDGVDAATSYTADTGQVATFFGTARIDANASAVGPTSLWLDGNSDYLEFPDSADYTLTADFTLECFVKFDGSVPTNVTFISHYDSQSGSNRSFILHKVASALELYSTTDGGAGAQQIVSNSWSPAADTMYHVACVRESNTVKMFIDGVQIGTDDTRSGSFFNSTDPLRIGAARGASGITEYMLGWIDGVRIDNGTALYRENFTPPQRKLRVPEPAALIANFNGVDAVSSPPGYSSEDILARPASFFGGAVLDTAQKKFGSASAYFPGGSPVAYLAFADSSPEGDYAIGAGDFSTEGWVRFDGDPGTADRFLWGHYTSSGDQRSWRVDLSNNTLRFSYSTAGTGGTTSFITNAWNPVTATWYHIQMERFDGILYMWVDGVNIGSDAFTATAFAASCPFTVGSCAGLNNTNQMVGWIDSVRFIKGTALRSRVVAPDVPFDGSADASNVLLNFEGANGATAYTSDDATGYTVTFNNSAALSNTERYLGETCLSVPASADHVIVPTSVAAGTNDFTMEFMVRFSSFNGSYNAILDQRTATNSATIYLGYLSGQIVFFHSGANRILGGSISANTWYHICLERVNNVTRLYVDGVQVGGDYSNAATYVIGSGIYIGADFAGGAGMNGYVDMVRYSPTKAIYGGDFTPPTMPVGEPIL